MGYSSARQSIAVSLVFLLVTSLLAGCSQSGAAKAPAAPDPQALFRAKVAQGDASWAAGDAAAALDLYSAALRADPAADKGGAVAAKEEAAKRLTLARSILAHSSPAVGSIGVYVQALDYASPDSTEAVAARRGLAACLQGTVTSVGQEIGQMRRDLKANKAIEMPITSSMALQLARSWDSQSAQAPGSAGLHAGRAAARLYAAASAVKKAYDRKYAEDALKDLASAARSTASADRELGLLRDGR